MASLPFHWSKSDMKDILNLLRYGIYVTVPCFVADQMLLTIFFLQISQFLFPFLLQCMESVHSEY